MSLIVPSAPLITTTFRPFSNGRPSIQKILSPSIRGSDSDPVAATTASAVMGELQDPKLPVCRLLAMTILPRCGTVKRLRMRGHLGRKWRGIATDHIGRNRQRSALQIELASLQSLEVAAGGGQCRFTNKRLLRFCHT